jgi:hypothetical protein
MADRRWRDGCKAMLTLTSIFAGLSGVGLTGTLTRPADDWRFFAGAGAILFSLYWFVRIAEMLTDALDEGKPGIYVDAMYWFNLAVLSAFAAISAFVSLVGTDNKLRGLKLAFMTLPDLAAIVILVAAFWRGPWRRDAVFLHCRRRSGVDREGQFIEISGDTDWNEWIASLQARTDS